MCTALCSSAGARRRRCTISMARGAAMKASLDAGRPVEVEEERTLADSLGGGIGLDNRLTFAMCRDLLDDLVLLTETEIAAGIRHAYAEEREVVEGAGAVGIAALLAGKVRLDGPVVAVLSGRNIDMGLHRDIVCGAWRDGRRKRHEENLVRSRSFAPHSVLPRGTFGISPARGEISYHAGFRQSPALQKGR